MSTLQGTLRARVLADTGVAALLGTRLYAMRLPENVVLPAATFQRISSRYIGAHNGPSGVAAMRYQFTAFAMSYNEAVELADAMRVALDGWHSPAAGLNNIQAAYAEGELDLYEPETARYFVPLDVMIWATIAVPA